MIRKLYDLAGADETFRFSPYCWRTKLALAHKNLSYETIPWRFTEKEAIAFAQSQHVPVLVDGELAIHDSQAIAEYLEVTYSNEASLFGDPTARAVTNFVRYWTEDVLHPAIRNIILPDIFERLHPKDQDYFRASREAAIGMTIEALAAARAAHLPRFEAALKPLRHTLETQSFIAGSAPAYADHIVFGAVRWATLSSATPLLQPDDPVFLWMHGVLATYGLDEA